MPWFCADEALVLLRDVVPFFRPFSSPFLSVAFAVSAHIFFPAKDFQFQQMSDGRVLKQNLISERNEPYGGILRRFLQCHYHPCGVPEMDGLWEKLCMSRREE